MHYIRLCRPPEVHHTHNRSHPAVLKLVLTITTDLSDAFLSPRSPLPMAVIGAYTARSKNGASTEGGQQVVVPVNLTTTNPPTWRAGMRVLKLELPLPALPQPLETLQIRPLSRELTALGVGDVLPGGGGGRGLVMGVYADMPPQLGGQDVVQPPPPPSVCFRSLRLSAGEVGVRPLQVEEDLGESIARHVWDSGVVMVALLAELCLEGGAGGKALPRFQRILLQQRERRLNVLELGCGVGVLGIGLARIMALSRGQHAPRILMTDLPEAEEKARANIARQAGGFGDAPVELDFEPLDWLDGQNGVFPEMTAARVWDLIMICDCTYNTDTLPPLVKTLSALHDHSARLGSGVQTEVLVATKPRHSSERVFFDLMSADGWVVREQTVLPLPLLDAEGQTVEVYLFWK